MTLHKINNRFFNEYLIHKNRVLTLKLDNNRTIISSTAFVELLNKHTLEK